VSPAPSVVSMNRQRLDQNSFFRHDFVLAAIAADFERGREPRCPGCVTVCCSIVV
jgi:hypothetical protein